MHDERAEHNKKLFTLTDEVWTLLSVLPTWKNSPFTSMHLHILLSCVLILLRMYKNTCISNNRVSEINSLPEIGYQFHTKAVFPEKSSQYTLRINR